MTAHSTPAGAVEQHRPCDTHSRCQNRRKNINTDSRLHARKGHPEKVTQGGSWKIRREGVPSPAMAGQPQLSSESALSTSSACPVTDTFGHTPEIRPSLSIRNVLRIVPSKTRPYSDFFFHVPYAV